jgi:hypothetical protein
VEDQQKQLDLPATMPCSFALPHTIWTSELEATFHCSLSTPSSSPSSLFCCYNYLWRASCYHSLSLSHTMQASQLSLLFQLLAQYSALIVPSFHLSLSSLPPYHQFTEASFFIIRFSCLPFVEGFVLEGFALECAF